MTGLVQFFETLLRKRFWIINAVFIFFIALIVALGINSLIAAQFAPMTVAAPNIESRSDDDDSANYFQGETADISTLLNPPRDEPETDDEEDPEDVEEDVEEEVEEVALAIGDCNQSSVQAILVGTMVDPNGYWSFGIVQNQTTNRTETVYPGQDLAGALVTRIERNRLFLLNEGVEECLKPGAEPAEPGERVATTQNDDEDDETDEDDSETSRNESTPVATGPPSNDLESSIEPISPTAWRIERDAIDEALENPRELQRQAPEFQQAYEDGRPAGIRLTSIPSGSIFTSLGIRQNDVIVSVNGHSVTTPQRAVELYEALQRESRVDLVVLRRGRTRTLTYEIN